MYILTVAVITLCGELVFGQFSPCLSADGRRKSCVQFHECEQYRSLANKQDKTEQDFYQLHRLFCGVRGNVVQVCCPDPVQRIISRQCVTPDGQLGECINLLRCPHLTNILQPPVRQEALSFVQSSRCFGPEEYSVCCGPPPTPAQTTTPRTTIPPQSQNLEAADCATLMTAFLPPRECCGLAVGVSNKIFGNATGIDEYPWAVVIEYISKNTPPHSSLACGGALISGKYVLTAAHCIAGRILTSRTPRLIRLGEYNTTNEGPDCISTSGAGEDCTEGVIRIRIEKTIPHPSYRFGQSKNHDIGLIRMTDTAPYTEFIRPICLPSIDLTRPENTPPYFSMYAVGWGATENSTYSDVKRDVNLPFVTLDKCQPAYMKPTKNVRLWEGQLCAGGIEAQDSCRGDSGGPLVYENQEKFELTGLVSFGPDKCGEKGTPGVYTNVHHYLDWINSVIVA